MSDFILDLRPEGQRIGLDDATRMLQFYSDIRVEFYDCSEFLLCLASCDRRDIWAPYTCPKTDSFVGICGRVAFDLVKWTAAAKLPGEGGLASKAIFQAYERDRGGGLGRLNGNFVVFLYEPRRQQLYVATDRTGTCLLFGPADGSTGACVYSSHPDLLARTLGVAEQWDKVSLAEFILTGKVSFPFTYYSGVRALPFGGIHRFDLRAPSAARLCHQEQCPLDFNLTQRDTLEDLAEELSEAFRKATERRTYPQLGRTAVALSGGLDSRAILCSAHERADLIAFCCIDEENTEYRTARAIAEAVGVSLEPLKRRFDHYGDHAEDGVRVSGGMGDIGSNHFLGFRGQILGLGTDSLITGCYCDYLFKSLVVDTTTHWLSRAERLGPFRLESYLPHFDFHTALASDVRHRLEARFPAALREDASEAARLEVAKRRTFPFQYEGDNVQRTTLQRTMRWYPPAVDSDVIGVYLRIPIALRMNKSIFSRMVLHRCNQRVCSIPDSNTGARVGAPPFIVAVNRYRIALRRALERRRHSIASDESWPNWSYYLRASRRIREIWSRPNPTAGVTLGEILGEDFTTRISGYFEKQGTFRGSVLFLRLLTAKIWLDQSVDSSRST